jgi:hypothetical protein
MGQLNGRCGNVVICLQYVTILFISDFFTYNTALPTPLPHGHDEKYETVLLRLFFTFLLMLTSSESDCMKVVRHNFKVSHVSRFVTSNSNNVDMITIYRQR